jgi:hypothetical protein
MARLRYIGSFRDVSYGADFDGELFESIVDAKRALEDRYIANGGRTLRYLATTGEEDWHFYPAVTPEAYILLWPLPEPTTQDALDEAREAGDYDRLPNGAVLMEDHAEIVVWIGRRHAVRHGSPEQHEEVERIRKGADVREAGSIVVTS